MALETPGAFNQNNSSYAAEQQRRAVFSPYYAAGVRNSSDFNVTAGTSGTVNIAAGEGIIAGSGSGQGFYYVKNKATVANFAMQTGNGNIQRLFLIVDDTEYPSDSLNNTDDAEFVAVLGTSPASFNGTTPPTSLPIADVTVATGGSVTNINMLTSIAQVGWIPSSNNVNVALSQKTLTQSTNTKSSETLTLGYSGLWMVYYNVSVEFANGSSAGIMQASTILQHNGANVPGGGTWWKQYMGGSGWNNWEVPLQGSVAVQAQAGDTLAINYTIPSSGTLNNNVYFAATDIGQSNYLAASWLHL